MEINSELSANLIWFLLLVIIIFIIPFIGAKYSSDADEDKTGQILWRMIRITLNIQNFEYINLLVALMGVGLGFLLCPKKRDYAVWGVFLIFMTIWLIWSAISFGLWNTFSGLAVDGPFPDLFKNNSRYRFGDEGDSDAVDLRLVTSEGSLQDEVKWYFGCVVFFTVCLFMAACYILYQVNVSRSTSNPASGSSSINPSQQGGGRRRRR
jgi:hypothetical protein